jgi:hypothetical protein
MHDLSGRGPQALEFLLEVPNRGVRGRAQEIRAVLLQAHSGQKGRELGARKDPKCALRSGRVHGITPVVEQHPEANDCLPQRAGGQAYLGKVLGGEGDGDHGRATFK